ncbi:hypothetical protein PVAG01_10174 [Phlyctema vagabunda]|uniref:Uncharacterized protein n=1 Tax=Phlyctema vagabunda TaxID=108571 RepID=A0ABR4P573_9HELO
MMTLTIDTKSAEALKDDTPMRVFYYPKACDFDVVNLAKSIQQKLDDIVQSFPSTAHHDSSHRFLAAECWGTRIAIVFDVNHDRYDWETAHSPAENKLPVFRLQPTKPTNLVRDTSLDVRINDRIAQLHNLNGFSTRPPYIADHTQGADPVIYTALRVKNAEAIAL